MNFTYKIQILPKQGQIRSNLVKKCYFGPKMAKIIYRDLESRSRLLFNTVLGSEYEFCVKVKNIVKRRSYLGQIVKKWSNLDPKFQMLVWLYGQLDLILAICGSNFVQFWPKSTDFDFVKSKF